MTKDEYYQLHRECLAKGRSEREVKSDLLFCKVHKRYCQMKICMTHNTEKKLLKYEENIAKVEA